MSKSMKGHKSPFKEKSHSIESKKKQSERKKEYYKTHTAWNKGKTLKHITDLQKDTKYMTDGIVQIKLKPEYWGEFIDIGFKFGTLQKYNKNQCATI